MLQEMFMIRFDMLSYKDKDNLCSWYTVAVQLNQFVNLLYRVTNSFIFL